MAASYLRGWGLPSRLRGSASSVGLATNIWVLVLVAEVEAEVVDYVAGVFDDVRSLLEVAGGSVAAQVLKLGHEVGVGGGGETREKTLAGEVEGTARDGQDGTLTARVLLLELGKVVDEAERLGVSLENLLGVAAEDDENVKVLEALVSLLEGDLGANNGTLLRENLGFVSDEGDLKGLAGCCRGMVLADLLPSAAANGASDGCLYTHFRR